jgi:hypothetical protein
MILNIIVMIFSIFPVLLLTVVIIDKFDNSTSFFIAIKKPSILDALWAVLLLGITFYYFMTRQKYMLIPISIGLISLTTALLMFFS